jgi:hypothetical protein
VKTLVWLQGDSLSARDPAARKYPEAQRVFVFDRPFLEKAQLSFKRIFFLYECAVDAAQEIRVGETVAELREAVGEHGAERLAVTESVSPRWKEMLAELQKETEVEVVPAVDLVAVAGDYEAKRFTPFWKKFGKEWGG